MCTDGKIDDFLKCNQENIDFLRDSYSKSLMGWSCGEVWKGERGELVEEHGFKVLGCFWNF